jgi:hypothetical protein
MAEMQITQEQLSAQGSFIFINAMTPSKKCKNKKKPVFDFLCGFARNKTIWVVATLRAYFPRKCGFLRT